MPLIAVTRRYDFPASHVLARADFTAAENERIYGKCANPAGHGHDYGLEVTVAGPVDARSGRVVDPEALDALVGRHVLSRLAHRHLNDDAWFADAVPTAENIARAVQAALEAPVRALGEARLLRIRVLETRRNRFEVGERR